MCALHGELEIVGIVQVVELQDLLKIVIRLQHILAIVVFRDAESVVERVHLLVELANIEVVKLALLSRDLINHLKKPIRRMDLVVPLEVLEGQSV